MGITFGRRIRGRRETLGLSAYRVGKDAGIKAPNYSTLESGKTPPSDSMIVKLAPVLGLDPATLRAWALADELGEEEARQVAWMLLRDRGNSVSDKPKTGQGSAVGGRPGRVIRDLQDAFKGDILALAREYAALKKTLRAEPGLEDVADELAAMALAFEIQQSLSLGVNPEGEVAKG